VAPLTGVPLVVLFAVLLYHWYESVPPSVTDAVTDNAVAVAFCVYVAPEG
jgi:hypothetical protein